MNIAEGHMQETQTSDARPVSVGKLVFGVALLAIGVLLFVDAIDLWEPREVWRFWPLFLIVIGVSNEIDAIRTRRGDGGYILIAIGTWLLAGSNEFLGLDYRGAFPIGIAVAGLGVIFHALLGIEGKKKQEKRS